jgi:hypothetical protein
MKLKYTTNYVTHVLHAEQYVNQQFIISHFTDCIFGGVKFCLHNFNVRSIKKGGRD